MTKLAYPKKKFKYRQTDKTYIGTFFIILSALFVFADKIFNLLNIELEHIHNFNSSAAFVYSLGHTLAPISIIIGVLLKPYIKSIIIPLFAYSVHLYFVLDSGTSTTDFLFWVYALGTGFLILIFVYFLRKLIEFRRKHNSLKTDIMEKLIEVDRERIAKQIEKEIEKEIEKRD